MASILSRRVSLTTDPVFQTSLTPSQGQVDTLVTHFIDQSTDIPLLTATVVGGLAYRLGKIGTLGVGAIHELPLLRIPFVLRGSASVVGLATEVTAFRGVIHGHASLTGQASPEVFWDARGFGRDFVNFGVLKSVGYTFRGQNPLFLHTTQSGAMVLGHNLAYGLNLATRPEGTLIDQLVYAEAFNLQFSAGMALGHHLTGGRWRATERTLNLQIGKTAVAWRSWGQGWITPFSSEPLLATLGNAPRPRGSSRPPEPRPPSKTHPLKEQDNDSPATHGKGSISAEAMPPELSITIVLAPSDMAVSEIYTRLDLQDTPSLIIRDQFRRRPQEMGTLRKERGLMMLARDEGVFELLETDSAVSFGRMQLTLGRDRMLHLTRNPELELVLPKSQESISSETTEDLVSPVVPSVSSGERPLEELGEGETVRLDLAIPAEFQAQASRTEPESRSPALPPSSSLEATLTGYLDCPEATTWLDQPPPDSSSAVTEIRDTADIPLPVKREPPPDK